MVHVWSEWRLSSCPDLSVQRTGRIQLDPLNPRLPTNYVDLFEEQALRRRTFRFSLLQLDLLRPLKTRTSRDYVAVLFVFINSFERRCATKRYLSTSRAIYARNCIVSLQYHQRCNKEKKQIVNPGVPSFLELSHAGSDVFGYCKCCNYCRFVLW